MSIVTVAAPDSMLRVARAGSGRRFSRITPSDARSERAGNRYDVVGGGVLYAADELRTCYLETLARFRPTPRMRELLAEPDVEESGFMVCGGVPQDWRLTRRSFELVPSDALPFVDVEAPETLQQLESELSSVLVSLGYHDNLDISDVRNRDRRLSRAIAQWAFTAQDAEGEALYSGIRYASRLDTAATCWAVFEGTVMDERAVTSIERADPSLEAVADQWGLRIF